MYFIEGKINLNVTYAYFGKFVKIRKKRKPATLLSNSHRLEVFYSRFVFLSIKFFHFMMG
jgi:hypothetical protein